MYNYFRNKDNSYKKVLEGLETYTDTQLEKDPIYLATTNAANISYLKERIDELMNLKQQIDNINSRVTANETGISNISKQFITSSQQFAITDPNQPIPQVDQSSLL
jgi:hypothetical protein